MRYVFIFLLSSFSYLVHGAENNSSPVAMSEEYFQNKSPEVMSNWMIYGFALTQWNKNNSDPSKRNLFEREMFSIKFMLDVRNTARKSGPVESDPDLDILDIIYGEGYLSEYVWVFLNDGTWKEPEGLKLNEFHVWADKHLKGHKPVKNAVFISSERP